MNAWIIIGSASGARVFSVSGRREPLRLVRELAHPQGRLKATETCSDRPGRVKTGLMEHGVSALDRHTSARDVDAARFARQVADVLREGRERNEYETLALVAPPHFLGLLRDEIDRHVQKLVACGVAKDLAGLEAGELPVHLVEVWEALERPNADRNAQT
jgi:protein required for attachment to host cells